MIGQAYRGDRVLGGLCVGAVQGGEVAGVVDDPQVAVDGGVLGDIADPVA